MSAALDHSLKSDTPAVSFEQVVKTYTSDGPKHDRLLAVDGVSFTVRSGELLVLLGPSGCGKSTSLRLIAGLEVPDAGEITISGRTVNAPQRGIQVPAERRGLGMVFQSYAIWPHMSVFQNIAYPLRVRRTPKKDTYDLVNQALETVGLPGMGHRPATRLSGGQQQRVALARALVFNPSLLLLDEPLSNLDAKLRVRMRTELREIQQRAGVSSVFVTHDQAESMAIADRIVVMSQGKVEQIGTPEDIYESPTSQFVADFVGASNLWLGHATSSDPSQDASVRSGVNGLKREIVGRKSSAMTGLNDGDPVFVIIRPERFLVSAARQASERPQSGQNAWKCTVISSTYYGDHREYRLLLDPSEGTLEKTIHVSTSSDKAFATGQTVYASCNWSDVIIAPVRKAQ